MTCPFTGPKMFCAGPNSLCQAKNLFYLLWQSQTFCAWQKDDLHSVELFFVPIHTKVLEEALNAVKFLGWLKKFGPAQNVLGPVKGQGISRSLHTFMPRSFPLKASMQLNTLCLQSTNSRCSQLQLLVPWWILSIFPSKEL